MDTYVNFIKVYILFTHHLNKGDYLNDWSFLVFSYFDRAFYCLKIEYPNICFDKLLLFKAVLNDKPKIENFKNP